VLCLRCGPPGAILFTQAREVSFCFCLSANGTRLSPFARKGKQGGKPFPYLKLFFAVAKIKTFCFKQIDDLGLPRKIIGCSFRRPAREEQFSVVEG